MLLGHGRTALGLDDFHLEIHAVTGRLHGVQIVAKDELYRLVVARSYSPRQGGNVVGGEVISLLVSDIHSCTTMKERIVAKLSSSDSVDVQAMIDDPANKGWLLALRRIQHGKDRDKKDSHQGLVAWMVGNGWADGVNMNNGVNVLTFSGINFVVKRYGASDDELYRGESLDDALSAYKRGKD